MPADLTWQPSLFDGGTPEFDASYARVVRIDLDDTSWIDYCPGWLRGSDRVFEQLLAAGDWQQRTRWMYDDNVLEPRLTAGWSTDARDSEVPAVLSAMAASLGTRYCVGFDRVWVNLYRDGADSVAWHGDRNRLVVTRPLVATVSLGARRRFQLRRRGTTRIAHQLDPGQGDLIVMGGDCQHDWEHTVPKTKARVGPRMSVTIRHTNPALGERWLREPSSTEPGHAW